MLREGSGNDIFSHYGLNNYNHVRGSTYRNDNRGDPDGR